MGMTLTLSTPKCPHCGRAEVLYEGGLTYNLVPMAKAAGLYDAIFGADTRTAADVIERLQTGLNLLNLLPNTYRAYNPQNGWGSYEDFVGFVAAYLELCKKHPDAIIHVT